MTPVDPTLLGHPATGSNAALLPVSTSVLTDVEFALAWDASAAAFVGVPTLEPVTSELLPDESQVPSYHLMKVPTAGGDAALSLWQSDRVPAPMLSEIPAEPSLRLPSDTGLPPEQTKTDEARSKGVPTPDRVHVVEQTLLGQVHDLDRTVDERETKPIIAGAGLVDSTAPQTPEGISSPKKATQNAASEQTDIAAAAPRPIPGVEHDTVTKTASPDADNIKHATFPTVAKENDILKSAARKADGKPATRTLESETVLARVEKIPPANVTSAPIERTALSTDSFSTVPEKVPALAERGLIPPVRLDEPDPFKDQPTTNVPTSTTAPPELRATPVHMFQPPELRAPTTPRARPEAEPDTSRVIPKLEAPPAAMPSTSAPHTSTLPTQNIVQSLPLPTSSPLEMEAELGPILAASRQIQGNAPPSATALFVPNAQAIPVAAQIFAAVSSTPAGTTEIALNPEELGRVRIRLVGGEVGLSVTILAERPETADLMRRNIDILAREFSELGHDNLTFSFSDDAPRDDGPQSSGIGSSSSSGPQEPTDDSIQNTINVVMRGGLDLKL